MDIDMNHKSMDELIKRDKKLGRVRQYQGVRTGPLPGRGRGNEQRAREQPRIRGGNQIFKQRSQRTVQTEGQLSKSQIRNRRKRERLMGDQNVVAGTRPAQLTKGTASRRQLLKTLRQKKLKAGKRAYNSDSLNAGDNTQQNKNAPLRKRQPQAPAVNNQQANSQQQAPQVNVVQGTLAQRKIKVRNIDARVVTQADLQKLFGKCGPIISASFDTNEFGAYIGSATVIYTKASSAARSIKDYNLAQIDNRPMKVQYAMTLATPAGQQRQATERRPTNNRIQKSGRGKTLNVMRGGRAQ